MLLAIALLAIDVRVPTHGVLTAGALICLVVGSLIFFNSNAGSGGPTLSPLIIGAFAAGVGLVSLLVLRYAISAQRRPVTTGREGLIGQRARVTVPLAPVGRVKLTGEDWAARLSERAAGQRIEVDRDVRVAAVEGLTLIVEPLKPQ
jgi:membrane-bound serine protease (ClpP class)